MGAATSRPPPRPWDVWDEQEERSPEAALEERKQLPPAIVARIQGLSESAETFLKGPTEVPPSSFAFDLEDELCLLRMDGAMTHDKRLSQWLPKLVPKRVSEAEFWSNYFAHVNALAGAVPGLAAAAATAHAVAPAAVDQVAKAGNEQKVGGTGRPGGEKTKAQNGVAASAGQSSARNRAAAEAQRLEQQRQQQQAEQKKALNGSVAAGSSAPVAGPPVGGGDPGGGRGGSAASPSAFASIAQQQQQQHKKQQHAGSSAMAAGATTSTQEEERVVQDYRLRHEEPLQEPVGQPQSLPIRWGIIGCGAVCEIKSGPAFRKVPGSRLVAVMRRTEALAADYAKRHNVPKYYTSAKALINDVEVDAVYIATPPGTHCMYALQVCAAGKPCYVEKPMARHYEECRVMVEQFYRAGLPLYVGYYRRRLDRFIAAKQIVSRFLGTITSVSYVNTRKDHIPALTVKSLGWRADPEQSGGGLFMDIGSHVIDILDFLLGPLLHVTGDAATHPTSDPELTVETNVTMTFRTQSGALGAAMWNFCSASYTDRLAINGTQGSLSMSVFGKDGPVLHLPNGRSIEYEHTYPEHVHQPLVHSIVQQLRGVPVPEERLSTGVSAARTALIMDTVLRKFYKSRQDHFWKRPNTWESAKAEVSYQ